MSVENWKKGLVVTETDSLENLLAAGQWGHHLLFSNEQIERAFLDVENRLSGLGRGTLERVNQAIASLVSDSTTVMEKRSLVEELPEDVRSTLIYLYFRILDQRLEQRTPTVH
ncbi:MAG: hypothetical protein ABIO70_16345 [Pseudomonadota bacterium]